MGWIKKIKIPEIKIPKAEIPAFIKFGKKTRRVPGSAGHSRVTEVKARKSGRINSFFKKAFGKEKQGNASALTRAGGKIAQAKDFIKSRAQSVKQPTAKAQPVKVLTAPALTASAPAAKKPAAQTSFAKTRPAADKAPAMAKLRKAAKKLNVGAALAAARDAAVNAANTVIAMADIINDMLGAGNRMKPAYAHTSGSAHPVPARAAVKAAPTARKHTPATNRMAMTSDNAPTPGAPTPGATAPGTPVPDAAKPRRGRPPKAAAADNAQAKQPAEARHIIMPLQLLEQEYGTILARLKDLGSRDAFETLANILDKNPDEFLASLKSLINDSRINSETAKKWGFANAEELAAKTDALKQAEAPPPPPPVEETVIIYKKDGTRVRIPAPAQSLSVFKPDELKFLRALKSEPVSKPIETIAGECGINLFWAQRALEKLGKLLPNEKAQTIKELRLSTPGELDTLAQGRPVKNIFTKTEKDFLLKFKEFPSGLSNKEMAEHLNIPEKNAAQTLNKLRGQKRGKIAQAASELGFGDITELKALKEKSLTGDIFAPEEISFLRAFNNAPDGLSINAVAKECGIMRVGSDKALKKLRGLKPKQRAKAVKELGLKNKGALEALARKGSSKNIFGAKEALFLTLLKKSPEGTPLENIAQNHGIVNGTAFNALKKLRGLKPEQIPQAMKELKLKTPASIESLINKGSTKIIFNKSERKFLLSYKRAPVGASIESIAGKHGVRLSTASGAINKLRNLKTAEGKAQAMHELRLNDAGELQALIQKQTAKNIFTESEKKFLLALKKAPAEKSIAETAEKRDVSPAVASKALAKLRGLETAEGKAQAMKELRMRDTNSLDALIQKRAAPRKGIKRAGLFTEKETKFLLAFKNAPADKSFESIAGDCCVSECVARIALGKLRGLTRKQKTRARKELQIETNYKLNILIKKSLPGARAAAKKTAAVNIFTEKEIQFLMKLKKGNPEGKSITVIAEDCGVSKSAAGRALKKLRALGPEQKPMAMKALDICNPEVLESLARKPRTKSKPADKKPAAAPENIFTEKEKQFLLAFNTAPIGKSISSIAKDCGMSETPTNKALGKLRGLTRKQKTRARKELDIPNIYKLNLLIKKPSQKPKPAVKKAQKSAKPAAKKKTAKAPAAKNIFTEKEKEFLIAFNSSEGKSIYQVAKDNKVNECQAYGVKKKLCGGLTRKQKTRARIELGIPNNYKLNALIKKLSQKPTSAGKKTTAADKKPAAPANIFSPNERKFLLKLKKAPAGKSLPKLAQDWAISDSQAYTAVDKLRKLTDKQKPRAMKELRLRSAGSLDAFIEKHSAKTIFTEGERKFLTKFKKSRGKKSVDSVAEKCGFSGALGYSAIKKLSKLPAEQKPQAMKELGIRKPETLETLAQGNKKNSKPAGKKTAAAKKRKIKNIFLEKEKQFLLALKDAPADKSIKSIAKACGVSNATGSNALTKLRGLKGKQKARAMEELQLKDKAEFKRLAKKRKPGIQPAHKNSSAKKRAAKTANIFTKSETKFLLALKDAPADKSIAGVAGDCKVSTPTAAKALKKLRGLNKKQKTRARKQLQIENNLKLNSFIAKTKRGARSAAKKAQKNVKSGFTKKGAAAKSVKIFTEKETKFLLAFKDAPADKPITDIAGDCKVSPAVAGGALRKLRALKGKQKTRAMEELQLENKAELKELAMKRKKGAKLSRGGSRTALVGAGKKTTAAPANIFTKSETKFLLALKKAPYGKTFKSIADDCGVSGTAYTSALRKLRGLAPGQQKRVKQELQIEDLRELKSFAKRRRK